LAHLSFGLHSGGLKQTHLPCQYGSLCALTPLLGDKEDRMQVFSKMCVSVPWATLLGALFAVTLSGCANFDALRAFAKDGSAVAATAKKDVDLFASSCAELKGESAVLSYAGGAARVPAEQSSTCKNVVGSAKVVAESLSVQLLVKYHEALNVLAGEESWTISKDIEALGAQVKRVQADGKALASAAEVEKYQGAFVGITNLLTAALREREAKRLLRQDLDWAEVLRPLRFWYGGPDGNSASLYSQACRIVRTDWSNVQSELLDYTRCDRKTKTGTAVCEPLTAAVRLANVEAKMKPVAACAPGVANKQPGAAAARVKLIDSWLEAHDELRRKAFDRDIRSLRERLNYLRDQVDGIKSAVD
jgi:hypothetical protein